MQLDGYSWNLAEHSDQVKLLPILDLMNHHEEGNAFIEYRASDNTYIARALRAIK